MGGMMTTRRGTMYWELRVSRRPHAMRTAHRGARLQVGIVVVVRATGVHVDYRGRNDRSQQQACRYLRPRKLPERGEPILSYLQGLEFRDQGWGERARQDTPTTVICIIAAKAIENWASNPCGIVLIRVGPSRVPGLTQ